MINRVLAFLVIAAILFTTGCASNSAPTASGASATAVGAPTAAPASAGSAKSPQAASAAATPGKNNASSGNIALQNASAPSGAKKIETGKLYKIGDAIQLPSGVIIQVNSAKTVEYDSSNEFVVLDMVIANTGKEKTTISSVLSFSVVSSDWHWYSLGLDDIKAMVGKGINSTFDTDLAPGEAKKGSTPIKVAKDAKQLGLVFENLGSLGATSEADPAVYISLGVRGDFQMPVIPADAQTVKAGTTYKLGDAFKAPKRGLALKVNSVNELTQSVPNATLKADQKFMIVDVTVQLSANAKALIPNRELRCVSADGTYLDGASGDTNAVAMALSTKAYREGVDRGIIVYVGERGAKDFSLKFQPIDGQNKAIAEEAATIALGTVQAVSSANVAAAPTKAPPAVTSSASLPAELKDIPMPSGFQVVKDSVKQFPGDADGVTVSEGKWFGKTTVKEVADFFLKNLPAKGWDKEDWTANDYTIQGFFLNKNSDSIVLYISAEKTDAGTEIELRVEKAN